MTEAQRIQNLDAVRGIAVLGILAVNALAFAWPVDAALALSRLPMAVDGVLQGSDNWAAWVVETFFTDKFRSLFCMLFGVSIFLVGGARDDQERSRKLRRRLGWLALIGLIHGLALWFGDILLLYAWTGLFVMLVRGLSAKTLLIIGAAITVSLMIIQSALGLMLPYMPADATAGFEGHAGVTTATIMNEVREIRSGFGATMLKNALNWAIVQGASLTIFMPAVFGLMCLGLGLFKAGFFHGRLPAYVYAALIVLGAAALIIKGTASWAELSVPPEQIPSKGMNMVGSSFAVIIALAYASIIVKLPAMFAWARPMGRMAFTTYLFQSLIMASLFYMPWGPKLFGQISPAGLWPIILAVWAVQIAFAHLWLKVYRWGPMEWIWRSLTEGKRLPLSKSTV